MRRYLIIIIVYLLLGSSIYSQQQIQIHEIDGHQWLGWDPSYKTSYIVGFCTGVWALQAIQSYSGMPVLDDPFDLRGGTIGEVIMEVDTFYALGPEYLDIPVFMAVYLRKDQYKKENL